MYPDGVSGVGCKERRGQRGEEKRKVKYRNLEQEGQTGTKPKEFFFTPLLYHQSITDYKYTS
jgi:hypothetical protein